MIPGTGLCVSSRGAQSWADPQHASSVAPGKRPRLTPNPALAIKDGAFVMPFGTPGGDVQIQAMLQTFVNIVTYGMNPQAAVEAPRFATMSFPNSFEPHEYSPQQADAGGAHSRGRRRVARRVGARGRLVAGVGLAGGRDVRARPGYRAGYDFRRRGPAAAGLRARVVVGGSDKGAAS